MTGERWYRIRLIGDGRFWNGKGYSTIGNIYATLGHAHCAITNADRAKYPPRRLGAYEIVVYEVRQVGVANPLPSP